MADVFIERIVKRKPDARQRLVRVAMVLGGLVLVAAAFLFLGEFFPVVFAAVCYLGFLLFRRQSWEFEYAVTNGEIDVDRIMGRSARKRLLSVDCRNFEVFLPFVKDNAREYESATIKKTVDVASSPHAEGRWFAVFQGKDGQRTMLVFEPDERMLDAIKHFLPRRIQRW